MMCIVEGVNMNTLVGLSEIRVRVFLLLYLLTVAPAIVYNVQHVVAVL